MFTVQEYNGVVTVILLPQIIVGEDSGAVTIFELNQDDDQPSTFERRNSKYDHNSSVLTISVSDDKNTVITAGMDLWYVRNIFKI